LRLYKAEKGFPDMLAEIFGLDSLWDRKILIIL
jgi:hypothetical protein